MQGVMSALMVLFKEVEREGLKHTCAAVHLKLSYEL